jgi:hypothetical protein
MQLSPITYGDIYGGEADSGTDWARLISTLAVAGVQAYGISQGQQSSTVITSGQSGISATSSSGPAAYTTFGNMGFVIVIGIIIAIILLYRK